MLPAGITIVLFIIMSCIVLSLIISAWREYRRHKQKLATQHTILTHPLDHHVTAILHMHDGAIVGVEKPPVAPTFFLPSSWYIRRRTLVSVGLLIMVLITFFVQDTLSGGTFQGITQTLGLTFFRPAQTTDVRPLAQPLPQTASTRLVRIDSAARNQYYTDYQWRVWAYSSCSGIAMAMVMNAYGMHLIAADVLQQELKLGVWDVNLGLLREEGVAMTAAYYGFQTDAGHTRTLQDVIASANKGTPVIVSVRDNYYYPGGHLFVIRGGDGQNVYIADSSPQNFQHMSLAMFTRMWQGFSAILTPKA